MLPSPSKPSSPSSNGPGRSNLVQFQELTDKLDVLRRLTGIRIQEQYNVILQNGWTLGATRCCVCCKPPSALFHRPWSTCLKTACRNNPADLLISVIPHFNREICEAGMPSAPAGLSSPSSQISPTSLRASGSSRINAAIRHCRHRNALSNKPAQSAKTAHIFATSGMILRPDFYVRTTPIRIALRHELGLKPDLTHRPSCFSAALARK